MKELTFEQKLELLKIASLTNVDNLSSYVDHDRVVASYDAFVKAICAPVSQTVSVVPKEQ
jgi:hypothetical protein